MYVSKYDTVRVKFVKFALINFYLELFAQCAPDRHVVYRTIQIAQVMSLSWVYIINMDGVYKLKHSPIHKQKGRLAYL